jgi:hypothetical protein
MIIEKIPINQNRSISIYRLSYCQIRLMFNIFLDVLFLPEKKKWESKGEQIHIIMFSENIHNTKGK